MALHEITLNAGGSRFATLMATREASLATNGGPGALRGYLYNAGKKKCFVNTRQDERDLLPEDVERQDVIGIPPGMAVPLPDSCIAFTFLVERGFTALYWIPGNKPPVFSMVMATAEDGKLYVEDAKTKEALAGVNAKLDAIIKELVKAPGSE